MALEQALDPRCDRRGRGPGRGSASCSLPAVPPQARRDADGQRQDPRTSGSPPGPRRRSRRPGGRSSRRCRRGRRSAIRSRPPRRARRARGRRRIPAFDGVSKTGPKIAKSAPWSRARRTSSGVCVERPDQEMSRAEHSAGGPAATGRPEAGRWTPWAPGRQGDVGTAVHEHGEGARRGHAPRSPARAAPGRGPLASHLEPVDAGGRELRAPASPGGAGAPPRATDGEQARNHRAGSRAATQEEIEVVQPPDQVEESEGGDQGTRSRRSGGARAGAEREQERGVIPGLEPGRHEQKEARLHAIDEEDSAEDRLGAHGRVDSSPPAQRCDRLRARSRLVAAVVLLLRRRGRALPRTRAALRAR